jgi:hypothetical protein
MSENVDFSMELDLDFCADGVVGEAPEAVRDLINPVTLGKKSFRTGKSLVFSANWVTNGFWLVHKNRVSNYRAFEDAHTVGVWAEAVGLTLEQMVQQDDEKLASLVPARPFELFELSAWADGARSLSVFTSDAGEVLFLDDDVVKSLELVAVFAHRGRGAVVDDPENPKMVVTTRRDVELDVTTLEGMLAWAKGRQE